MAFVDMYRLQIFANKTITIGSGERGNGNNSTSDPCLTRGEHQEMTKEVHWGWIELCEAMTHYSNMRECVEQGPHAFGHLGLGAVMGNAASSVRDASFFLHHGLVDWQWKRWQDADREGRTKAVDEYCAASAEGGNGGGCTARVDLETVLSSRGLYPDLTVADVLDTENYRICYRYDDT